MSHPRDLKEAWTANSKAFLFSPGGKNTSLALQATGLEKNEIDFFLFLSRMKLHLGEAIFP